MRMRMRRHLAFGFQFEFGFSSSSLAFRIRVCLLQLELVFRSWSFSTAFNGKSLFSSLGATLAEANGEWPPNWCSARAQDSLWGDFGLTLAKIGGTWPESEQKKSRRRGKGEMQGPNVGLLSEFCLLFMLLGRSLGAPLEPLGRLFQFA